MSLKDLMKSDLSRFTTDLGTFAETGTYTPQDGTGTFSLSVCPGDAAPTASMSDGGISQREQITATAVKSVFDAGMITAGLTGKDPLRGDTLTISTGDMAATWRVDAWWTDSGGGLSFSLMRNERATVSANGTREA